MKPLTMAMPAPSWMDVNIRITQASKAEDIGDNAELACTLCLRIHDKLSESWLAFRWATASAKDVGMMV